MLRAGVIVGVVLVALLALAWGLQRRFVYLPDRSTPPPAGDVLAGARDVTLHTADGLRLGAWLVPPTSGDRGVGVLVASGNGGNRADRAPLARALAAEGFTVLLFDYRGYGGNPGAPTETGLAADVRAAQRALAERGPQRQIYLGESLGASVVTDLATERPPAALLLRSPFIDLAAAARANYPVPGLGLLLRDHFPVAERIRQVDVPTTVVLGEADGIVPPEQSSAVAAAAPALVREVRIPGADHNDPALNSGDAVVDAVVELANLVQAPG